jgi:hypothetical protein
MAWPPKCLFETYIMTPHEHHHQNGHTPNDGLNPRDELAWTAFLYSVGELPEAEAARFEDRLEADSSAQAALAQVVALSAGVQLAAGVQPAESTVPVAAPVTTRPDDNFGRRAAGWILLATAASVALWFSLREPTKTIQSDPALKTASIAAHDLAMAWAAGQPGDDDLVVVDLPADEELQSELDAMPVIEDPSAPDWLIAALVDAQTSPVRTEN